MMETGCATAHNIGFTPPRLRRSGPTGHALLWASGARSGASSMAAHSRVLAASLDAARVVNPGTLYAMP